MKLFENLPNIVALLILAVVGYAIYKAVTAIQNCGSFFQWITTGSCSQSGATGTGGSGFPGFPGSTAPGGASGVGDPYNCSFLGWLAGHCINLQGGSCGVSDYWSGNCSAPSTSGTTPTSTPTADDSSGYNLTDDVFNA